MLTTPTAWTLISADPINLRKSSIEHVDSTQISFAESFDESSAGSVVVPLQILDKRLRAPIGTENCVGESNPANDRKAIAVTADVQTKQDVKFGKDIQSELTGTKSQRALSSQKFTPPRASGAISLLAVDAARNDQSRSKDFSQAIQPEISEAPISSENLNSLNSTDTSSSIDGTKTVTEDKAAEPRIDGADLQLADVSGTQVGSLTQNQKKTAASDKDQDQEAVLPTRTTKNHGSAVKIEKSAKSEVAKPVQVVEKAPGVEAKAPNETLVLPTGVTQHGSIVVAGDGALYSERSSRSSGDVGMTTAQVVVHDKNAGAIKKADDGAIKIPGSVLAEDPASRRSGSEEPKAALSSVKGIDIANATTRNMTEQPMISGPAHVESSGLGPRIAAATSIGIAAHVAAASGTQISNINTHAATVEAGSIAMDGASSADGMHKTLTATPTSLEIGVVNGTHGWLKIRADLTDSGVINASLSTATSSGQEMLHRELPSLTAYLQSEHVTVNTVVIQATTPAGADFRGLNGGTTGNEQGLAQQNRNQEGENRHGATGSTPAHSEKEGFYNNMSGVDVEELLPLVSRSGGGSWLNVRA